MKVGLQPLQNVVYGGFKASVRGNYVHVIPLKYENWCKITRVERCCAMRRRNEEQNTTENGAGLREYLLAVLKLV